MIEKIKNAVTNFINGEPKPVINIENVYLNELYARRESVWKWFNNIPVQNYDETDCAIYEIQSIDKQISMHLKKLKLKN